MPQLSGPLFSLDAHGTIKQGPTYQVRNGTRYASGPRTPDQPLSQHQADYYTFLRRASAQIWAHPNTNRFDWRAASAILRMSPMAAFLFWNAAPIMQTRSMAGVALAQPTKAQFPWDFTLTSPVPGRLVITRSTLNSNLDWVVTTAIIAIYLDYNPFAAAHNYEPSRDATAAISNNPRTLNGLPSGAHAIVNLQMFNNTSPLNSIATPPMTHSIIIT